MNDDPVTSVGNTSHQNGSSPYGTTRGGTDDLDEHEFDQQRGQGNLSDNEIHVDKQDGIFPSKKSPESLSKAKKKQKRLQQRY